VKVALLIGGNTELSWALIRRLSSEQGITVRVFSSKRPLGLNSPGARIQKYRLQAKLFIRTSILGEDHPPLQIPLSNVSQSISPNVNSGENLENLRQFEPDVMVISGTKMVADSLLQTAGIAVNIHHGFLPLYRGVSSLDWVIRDRNYNYFSVMLHEAVPMLDAGPIINARYITPYFLESLELFERRLFLTGLDLVVDFIRSWPEYSTIQQPSDWHSIMYRHKDKLPTHREEVSQEYRSKNLFRYCFLQRYRPYLQRIDKLTRKQGLKGKAKKLTAVGIINWLTRQEINPGFYILTYHDICADQDAAWLSEAGVPLIFTGRSNFHSHLDYLRDNFQCVPLKEGIQMWKEGRARNEPIISLTFDDGLSGYASDLELLGKYNLRPTLFLSGDPVLRNRPLRVHKEYLVEKFCRVGAERKTNVEREFEDILHKGFLGSGRFLEFVRAQYLNAIELKTFLKQQLVPDLGSHTSNHTSLAEDDIKTQEEKILLTHYELKRLFGEPLSYFSFPFGKLDRMSFASEYLAQTAAETVFQCNGGINQNPESMGSVLRIAISDGDVKALDRLLRIQWVR
jgi:peptidoglycan/xylan/chitin deacetylase (PgdA/CDA1 family)